MAAEKLPDNVDLVILGTGKSINILITVNFLQISLLNVLSDNVDVSNHIGMTESLIAAAFARIGYSVLHLDG